MKAIELGGGEQPKIRPNADSRSLPTVDIVCDFEKPLPLPSNEYDYVYSAYLLEHISWRHLRQFVKEVWRILTTTGSAMFVTANLQEQCKKVLACPLSIEDTSCLIFGGQDYQANTHRCGFSPEQAIKLFQEAGFIGVRINSLKQCNTDMVIEAWKLSGREAWMHSKLGKSEKILDIGSNRGTAFKGYGFTDITSVDLETYDLENFLRMDATHLGFRDKSFDVSILGEVIEHVPDPVKIMSEASRVAKRLVITTPDPANWHESLRPYETAEESVKRKGKSLEEQAREDQFAKKYCTADGCKHLFHHRWYTKEVLEQHLKQAGISDYVLEQLTYGGWSFFCVETGTKPQAEITPKVKVNLKPITKSKLKIALISTPYCTTSPPMYGGLEMIVADLGETLAEMGHDVTVFAADGSKVEGCKIVEFGSPLMNVNIDWIQAERKTYEIYKDHLKDFQIIHGHDWLGFEYLAKAKNPQLKVLHTHHGGFNLDFWKRTPPPFQLNLIAISNWMVKVYASQGFTTKRCYNGINLKKYPLKRKKGNRLLFLGRISKIKAPHLAIEIAKKANMGLDVVGGTNFIDDPAYLEHVKSLCDGEQVRFVGEVSHAVKLDYLQNAQALVVPSSWGEPFGLHVIESMAVGTPVVALPDGGIAETVREGGVLCKDIDAMVDAVKAGGFIATRCRRNAMRFSREIMAQNYVKLYMDVLSQREW